MMMPYLTGLINKLYIMLKLFNMLLLLPIIVSIQYLENFQQFSFVVTVEGYFSHEIKELVEFDNTIL